MVRKLTNKILLGIDNLNWRFQTSSLRCEIGKPYSKTVLFCDLMSMIATAKVESIIAGALRLQGYQPAVLLKNRSPILEYTFRAVKDVQFFYLSDYIDENILNTARAEAGIIMRQSPSFKEILDMEIDGYRTGKNVLSVVLRQLRTGRLDENNKLHLELTEKYLAESLAVMGIMDKLLGDIRPDLTIVCERGYTPAGEVFDACLLRGVDVVQWVGAPQSDSLIYKRYNKENRSHHQLALSDNAWEELLAMPWNSSHEERLMNQIRSHYDSGAWYNRQQLQEGKRIKKKEEILEQLGLDTNKKTAVIFTHILYDATFYYGESLFNDYGEWLIDTVRNAIANTDINWVIKVHPANVWRSRMDGVDMDQLEAELLEKELGKLPAHIKFMSADSDINTYSLFSSIDYGLTVRGTIGMELPCFGIPVVTAGSGRYSGRGFTIDPASREEYRKIIQDLHNTPPLDKKTVELARRYAYGIFFMRPLPMQSFRLNYHAGTYGLDSLKQNAALYADIRKSLSMNSDLNILTNWLVNKKESDLLVWDDALNKNNLQIGGPGHLRMSA